MQLGGNVCPSAFPAFSHTRGRETRDARRAGTRTYGTQTDRHGQTPDLTPSHVPSRAPASLRRVDVSWTYNRLGYG